MNTEIEIITDEARLRPESSEVERLWADNAKAKNSSAGSLAMEVERGSSADWPRLPNGFTQPDNLRGYKADIYNL